MHAELVFSHCSHIINFVVDLVTDNNEGEYAAVAAATTNTNSEKAAGSIREMDRERGERGLMNSLTTSAAPKRSGTERDNNARKSNHHEIVACKAAALCVMALPRRIG